MVPVSVITMIAVIVLAVIAAFQKEGMQRFTAGDAVLAGVHFLALMGVIFAVTTIGFIGIERLIPDLLTDNQSWKVFSHMEEVRYALAILIILSPVYLGILWKSAQTAAQGISWMRRSMAGAILIIAGSVGVGTLITLVYGLLSGNLGLRMITEIAFLLVVTAGVAAYYQIFIRTTPPSIPLATKMFGVGVALVSLGIIIWGFVITGGPSQARAARFDDRRLSDLSNMQWEIQSYWQENGALPKDLGILHDAVRGYSLPADPATKEAYGYRVVSEGKETLATGEERSIGVFELCATFETERTIEDLSGGYTYPRDVLLLESSFVPSYYPGDTSPHWNHGVGEQCFERTLKESLDTNKPY
jgi:hypothetical protein